MFETIIPSLYETLKERLKLGDVKSYKLSEFPHWERKRDVVLRKDLAYEIGKKNSGLFILWTKDAAYVADNIYNRIYISSRLEKMESEMGSEDSKEFESIESVALIIISGVGDVDDYRAYREMRERFYNLTLRGVTLRILPGRVWLRISRAAREKGFGLGILARAVIEEMNSLKFVLATDVAVLRYEDVEVKVLQQARKICDALVKMHEEKVLECDECEYRDVCREIPELKRIREELRKVK